MDVTTFYALFSTTCFTLTGLWWNVVRARPDWAADPAIRRAVGGIYLSFLLPALMGLFAQVGGTESPLVWRLSFVVISLVGGAAMVRLLARSAVDRSPRAVVLNRVGAAVVYVGIAVVGAFPRLAGVIGLTGIQVAALLLITLVALGHALVWRFMVTEAGAATGSPHSSDGKSRLERREVPTRRA